MGISWKRDIRMCKECGMVLSSPNTAYLHRKHSGHPRHIWVKTL